MNQAIRNRAVNPDAPLPPVAEILTRFTHPPEPLIAKAKTEIDGLIKAAEVKKGKLAPVFPFSVTLPLTPPSSPPKSTRQTRPERHRQTSIRAGHRCPSRRDSTANEEDAHYIHGKRDSRIQTNSGNSRRRRDHRNCRQADGRYHLQACQRQLCGCAVPESCREPPGDEGGANKHGSSDALQQVHYKIQRQPALGQLEWGSKGDVVPMDCWRALGVDHTG